MRIETTIFKNDDGISVVIYTKDRDRFVTSKVSVIFRSDTKEYILLPEAAGGVVVYYASLNSNCVLPLSDGVFEAKYSGVDFSELTSIEVLAVSDDDEIMTEKISL